MVIEIFKIFQLIKVLVFIFLQKVTKKFLKYMIYFIQLLYNIFYPIVCQKWAAMVLIYSMTGMTNATLRADHEINLQCFQ